jgi:L-ribulokinase
MKISRSAQTCALGSAVAAAVAAGVYPNFTAAQKKMTSLKPTVFKPNAKAHAIYKQLYVVYRKLHDAFGTRDWNGGLYDVMKELIDIRNRARL